MNISLEIKGARELQAKIENLARAQMPFAISKAVNETAYAARDQMEVKTRAVFIIRRPWVATGWRVLPSKKRDEPKVATLYLDPSRDMLAKFEQGGQKTSRTGLSLAVPEEARRGKSDIVPAKWRIRALQFTKHVTKAGKIQLKGLDGTFIAKGTANTVVLRRTRRALQVLYVFKRAVPIPASLQFYKTARDVVRKVWSTKLSEAIALAIRSAK
jgi:hypothetical protein